MKISNIQMQGFRSLYDINWKPGDFNIVIGPNGSGKSNLLKALEMLSKSARGNLSQQVQREGGLDSLICCLQSSKIQFKLLGSYTTPGQESESSLLTYQLDLSRSDSSSSHKIDYEILGDFSQFERRFKPKSLIMLEHIPPSAVFYSEQNHNPIYPQEPIQQNESLLSTSNVAVINNKYISLYHHWLSHWQIYHDFLTHRDAPVRQPAVAIKETILAADGNNLVPVLYTLYENNRDFKINLNTAMRSAFGGDYDGLSFQITPDKTLQLQINWKSFSCPQSSSDLSDGTLRFLYLMTILLNPYPPTLIAIDEIENGLHPSMLPVLVHYARLAAHQTQIIFTTHSEKFLDAFHDCHPTVTTTRIHAGKTHLDVLSGESLRYWLKESTINNCFSSEELREAAF
jgi:predicted ATPase